jgi:PAS domain-containing protein
MSLDTPPAAAAAPAADPLIAAEQRSQLHGHARLVGAASVGSLGGALLGGWSMQGAVPLQRLAAWLALLVAVLVVRWLACRPARSMVELSPAETQQMVQRVRLLTLAHGVTWGALAWLPPGPAAVDTLIPLSLLIGAAALVAMMLALFDAQAAAAFAAPALLLLALRWAAVDGPLPRYTVLALLMTLMMVAVVTGAARMARRARLDVAAAHRVEAERLRRTEDAEALLRRVFDHVGEGLCMFDTRQRLVAWNQHMLALTGVDPALARVGTPLRDLLVDMGRRGEFGEVDPEAEADLRLSAMLQPGVGFVSRTRPDGSTVELRRNPMPDGGFTLVAVDVSERRASEQALASNRNVLKVLLDSTEEGVWFIDNDQCTTDANPAMCRMLGLSHDALMGAASSTSSTPRTTPSSATRCDAAPRACRAATRSPCASPTARWCIARTTRPRSSTSRAARSAPWACSPTSPPTSTRKPSSSAPATC